MVSRADESGYSQPSTLFPYQGQGRKLLAVEAHDRDLFQ